MAQKPRERQVASLSPAEIRSAIPKLQRRVAELSAIKVADLTDADFGDLLHDLETRIDDTLVQVFGHDTVDYHRYTISTLDETPIFVGGGFQSIEERRPNITRGIASAISTLRSAISVLSERLEDSGETAASRAMTAYKGLDLHNEIARAASTLYHGGHYAHAVEDSVKALNGLVRLRSGLENDGVPLMQQAL